MSTPTTPDSYKSLMNPWKPIDQFAPKNVASVHDRLEVDHGTKDGDVVTDGVGAVSGSNDDDLQRVDAEISDTDSIATNIIVGNRAQVSTGFDYSSAISFYANSPQQKDFEMEDSGVVDVDNIDVDGSSGDEAQIHNAGATDTENDAPQHIDTKCVAVSTCVADSSDHRKVVSHIFGRNKACTRDLPNHLWIFWCRKHYQRLKYRAEDAENWHTIQLGLVRNQLQTFEDWGEVRSWTVALRKAEQDALNKEKKDGATHTDYVSSCWERFLVPLLGRNKTFAQVREVLKVIADEFDGTEYRNRDKKLKLFPGVEFLPFIQKPKEVKKPAIKKSGIGYKKITLDQPAFKRKTHVNNEILKDMAAKKGEASNTPKSSGTASKEVSPDTDNASDASATKKGKTFATVNATYHTAHHKRKPVDTTTVTPHSTASPTQRNSITATVTPPASRSKETPTKRRRLTRGYEKHGSEGEDSTFMEKEDEE